MLIECIPNRIEAFTVTFTSKLQKLDYKNIKLCKNVYLQEKQFKKYSNNDYNSQINIEPKICPITEFVIFINSVLQLKYRN